MAAITIHEVGPRDGLQNEAAPITTADKVAFIDRLSAARLPVIEVTALPCSVDVCMKWWAEGITAELPQ